MRILQIINWLIFALTGFIALCIGVVIIIYLFHIQREVSMQDDWPNLVLSFGVFTAVAVASGTAAYSMWKEKAWRWLAQLALVLGLAGVFWFINSLR